MDSPKIAVIAKREELDGRTENVIHESINQAILQNGGRVQPVLTATVKPLSMGLVLRGDEEPSAATATSVLKKQLSQVGQLHLFSELEQCDGIVLQGGFAASELYEGFAAFFAYQRDVPLLGICAGMQVMTQMRGGRLAEVTDRATHATDTVQAHDLKIDPDSQLFQIMQTEHTWANSRHIYVVEDLGDLTASAWAPDGVIEACEAKDKRFYVGVQFHPENIYRENPAMRNIFRGFVQAAAAYRQERLATASGGNAPAANDEAVTTADATETTAGDTRVATA